MNVINNNEDEIKEKNLTQSELNNNIQNNINFINNINLQINSDEIINSNTDIENTIFLLNF